VSVLFSAFGVGCTAVQRGGIHVCALPLMQPGVDSSNTVATPLHRNPPCRWLAEHLNVGAPGDVNLFETTIRILGGLLSAQALSADSHPGLSRRLAEKAAELGARLMPAFDSPSGGWQRRDGACRKAGRQPGHKQVRQAEERCSQLLLVSPAA
jgi:hypothetical protein